MYIHSPMDILQGEWVPKTYYQVMITQHDGENEVDDIQRPVPSFKRRLDMY